MAPRKIDNGFLIVLDVGINTDDVKEKSSDSFFQKARNFAARLIERKIISQSTDFVGILLLGSKETSNNLNTECGGGYKHLKLHTELKSPNWQMIRDLPEKPSKSKGDWFDALIVAADHFKNGVHGVQLLNKKIILVTNFDIPTEQDSEQIEQILAGFQEENLVVDIIGIDLEQESYQNADIDLAKQFVEQTFGNTAPFDQAMSCLQFHRKRKKMNPYKWNVDLSIGPNIKIPVSAYIRLRYEADVDKWNKAVKDAATNSSSTTEFIKRDKQLINQENQNKRDKNDLISAYLYGQEPIPIADCDSIFYKSGPTCLSVYGFTDASNINWHNLSGNGLHYIFGRRGDTKSQYVLRCLVECLHELKLVGIARKVTRLDCATKMCALMPVFDANDYVCLSMAEIGYKEQIKHLSFPPTNLKKYSCTEEQVDAFKDLIKAMDLTKAYDDRFDDEEAFPVGESVSPAAQYMFDCIAYRAMNPGKPLPQPRDEIMNLFKAPPLVEKRSREALDKIKTLFSLKAVELPKTRQRKAVDVQKQHMMDIDDSSTFQIKLDIKPKIVSVERIRTIDPINDFKSLTDQGKTLIDLAPQMMDAIENLLYFSLDGSYVKPLDAMKFFRGECVKTDPTPYNDWIVKFKTELTCSTREDILKLIDENNVSLILKSENKTSSYESEKSHEDSQIYEINTVPDSMELTIATEIDDMFDEM